MSSPSMRDLLAVAREDAPDDVARDAVWHRVAGATVSAGAATAITGMGVAAPAKIAMTKLLAIGAIVGAAGTALGVAVIMKAGAPTPPAPPTPTATTTQAAPPGTMLPPVAVASAPAKMAASAAAIASTSDTDFELPAEPAKPTDTRKGAAPRVPSDPASELAEEARLVTDARSALVAGDPARALTLLRQTHKLNARALEPEELVLEARALRALGDADGAAATELRLKHRFPNHRLAR